MPALIEQFRADSDSLERAYPVAISSVRIARFEKFYADEQAMLEAIDFDELSHEDKIDYLLLKNRSDHRPASARPAEETDRRDAAAAPLRGNHRVSDGRHASDEKAGCGERCRRANRDGQADRSDSI